MYTSFYTAARGAMEEQKKLDVVANNIANVNNYGFKPQDAVFSDLMYYSLNNYKGDDLPMKAGTGIVVERTRTNFDGAGHYVTHGTYDYSIEGDGFFMVANPIDNTIGYTRNGHFSMSKRGEKFYLVNDNGNLVLDQKRQPITVTDGELSGKIGVYGFQILDGMLNTGNNEFAPIAKNGAPVLIRDAKLVEHALESSGVNLADEVTKMIETQRAYSYALRMVQTSDEVVSTINALR